RSIVISGSHSVRLFNVETGTAFTVTSVGLVDGFSSTGAAIYNNGGVLTLLNTRLEGNVAAGNDTFAGVPGSSSFGGAIYNLGTLVASNCVFRANRATGGQDATDTCGAAFSAGSACGGAIYNANTATILACTFAT